MKILTPTDKGLITLTLTDGETNLYIRAKMFNKELVDVTPSGSYINLTHVYGGMYAYKHSTGFANGSYIVVFEVFDDASFVYASEKYGIVEENLWVSDFLSQILTEIPDNILLDDDSRLNNLNTIPSLATTSQLNTHESHVITQITDTVDDSDGGAV